MRGQEGTEECRNLNLGSDTISDLLFLKKRKINWARLDTREGKRAESVVLSWLVSALNMSKSERTDCSTFATGPLAS